MGSQRLSEEAIDLLASLRIMLTTHAHTVTEFSRKYQCHVSHICTLIALIQKQTTQIYSDKNKSQRQKDCSTFSVGLLVAELRGRRRSLEGTRSPAY